MIAYFLLLLRTLFLLGIAFVIGAFFLLFHQDVVPYLAQKYHKEFGIEYTKIEGSLFYGVAIDGLSYGDGLQIKRVELKYNLLHLLRPTPKIEHLFVDGLILDPSKLPASESNTTTSQATLPAFFLQKLSLENISLRLEEKKIDFDLQADALYFDGALDVEAFLLDLSTQYGNLAARGVVQDSQVRAQTKLKLEKSLQEKYLASFTNLPRAFTVDLLLDEEGVKLQTQLDAISLRENEAIKLQESSIRVAYPFAQEKIFVDSNSTLVLQEQRIEVSQSGSVDTKGKFISKMEVNIEDLFAQKIAVDVAGDTKHLDVAMFMQEHSLKLNTTDYQNYSYQVQSPLVHASGLLGLQENRQTLQAMLEFQDLDPKMQKLELFIENKGDETKLSLDSLLLKLQLSREQKRIEGGGSIASNHFHLLGDIDKKELTIYSELQSLHASLVELGIIKEEQELRYDAKIQSATTLFFAHDLLIKSQIDIPYYKIQLDEESIYQGENVSLSLSYQNQQLFIDSYTMFVQDQKIFASKASKISIQSDQDILLESVFINDALLLTGRISPLKKQAQLHLQSDSFMYDSKDANLTLAMDVDADIEFGGKQKIQGEVSILDGAISYMPKEDYKITDKDIIILQDIKEELRTQREVDIKLSSKKGVKYNNENIDLEFVPKLQLTQKSGGRLVILGGITIERGEINVSDRVFEFDQSELTFKGTEQINPQLNLKLHHYTLDNIDIEIYITHTMEDPVIIFSSKPAMSQEDILSYILFGERASSVFDTSGDGDTKSSVSALLLGSGLKELLNQSDMFKVDTLNILTNEEGTLGYEIGAKLDKDFRIVYKNDTVSSIILQYSLSRNIRLDVDVDETGQGVSILYVKDFSLDD